MKEMLLRLHFPFYIRAKGPITRGDDGRVVPAVRSSPARQLEVRHLAGNWDHGIG